MSSENSIISAALGILVSELGAYDIDSGQLLWSIWPTDNGSEVFSFNIIITGDVVWILSTEKNIDKKPKKYLRAHNIYTGELLSKRAVAGCNNLILAGDKLIAYSNKKVLAFEMK